MPVRTPIRRWKIKKYGDFWHVYTRTSRFGEDWKFVNFYSDFNDALLIVQKSVTIWYRVMTRLAGGKL